MEKGRAYKIRAAAPRQLPPKRNLEPNHRRTKKMAKSMIAPRFDRVAWNIGALKELGIGIDLRSRSTTSRAPRRSNAAPSRRRSSVVLPFRVTLRPDPPESPVTTALRSFTTCGPRPRKVARAVRLGAIRGRHHHNENPLRSPVAAAPVSISITLPYH